MKLLDELEFEIRVVEMLQNVFLHWSQRIRGCTGGSWVIGGGHVV